MTIEITVLLLTSILAASLWIPYIVGVNTTVFEGQAESFSRPPDHRAMKPWIHRAHRAHLNLLEQFAPFAAVVLTAQALDVSTAATQVCAVAFLALRIVHAAGMISGLARFPLRPIVFTLGWVSILVLVQQIFAGA